MVTSFRRRVVLSVLIAFLAGLGSWELQARALAHQVEHAMGLGHPVPAVDYHGHDHDCDAPPSDSPAQDGDHAVFHALSAIPELAVPAISQAVLDHAGFVRSLFVTSRVLPAGSDPPLRPPKASRTLA